MKYLLIFCIILSNITSHAQTYTPFPTDSTYWKGAYYLQGDKWQQDSWSYYEFFQQGDTVISSTSYHKIYHTEKDYYYDWLGNNDSSIYTKSYYGGLRENAKKIYLLNKDSVNENIVYDFNKGIGDTVYYWGTPYPPITITLIDTLSLKDGTPHKRFWVPSCQTCSQWYAEGVGSSTGLFPNYNLYIPYFGYNCMDCFSVNNMTLYSDTSCFSPTPGECDHLIISGIQETQSPGSLNFNIIPNPVSQAGELTIVNTDEVPAMCNIYSVTGALKNTFKISGSKDINLNPSLPSGIYLMKIETSKGVLVKKLIVD